MQAHRIAQVLELGIGKLPDNAVVPQPCREVRSTRSVLGIVVVVMPLAHVALRGAQRLKRVFGIEIDSCVRCGARLARRRQPRVGAGRSV